MKAFIVKGLRPVIERSKMMLCEVQPNVRIALVSTSTNNNHNIIFATPIHPPHYRLYYEERRLTFATYLRRKRVKYERFNEAQLQSNTAPPGTAMNTPFVYLGETLDVYNEKANLSPWTPVPDSVARKIFDSAQPQPDDIHVELGSGDGRVNFHAIDYGIRKSIGIDVDPDIVERATDRLRRIHPQPNIQFVVENLMDPSSHAWTHHVPTATILTMYFAKDGLEKIRPMLEQSLRGKRCKIYTCGYAMPGWESQIVETVLDMPIYFYDWGNADVHLLQPESFVDALPPGLMPRDNNMDQYMRRNKKSTFQPNPLPGFHFDDLKDNAWDDFGPFPDDATDKEGKE